MKILLFGAGRSSIYFIEYILEQCKVNNWKLSIADFQFDQLPEHVAENPRLLLVNLDISKEKDRQKLISSHDFVVSMLPARFHIIIAKDCVKFSKSFANASYVTDELKALEPEILSKGLLFAGELGLDPGLDHMSAMEMINDLKNKGATIHSFTSFTGGLVAPESDTNPWHYKISWNPRNIILAGTGMAEYKSGGQILCVPYHQLFRKLLPLHFEKLGEFEGYPNRDSLQYEQLYGLDGIESLQRGTIRYKGFCEAWNILVQLGFTSEDCEMDVKGMTIKDFAKCFVPEGIANLSVDSLENLTGIKFSAEALAKLKWIEFDSEELITGKKMTPAQVLEQILVKRWVLMPGDKDMVIMQHEFKYKLDGENYILTSTLTDIGQDDHYTSMAKLVGLPLGIYVKNYLLGKIKGKGFKIPVEPFMYEVILKELNEKGIRFKNVTRKDKK